MNYGRFNNNNNKVKNLDSNNMNFNSMRNLSPIKKKSNDDNISYESKVSITDINLINSDNYNIRQFSRNPNYQKLNSNFNYNTKKLKPFSNKMINLILFLKTSYNNNANISPLNILSKLKEFDDDNQSQNNTMNNIPKNYIDNYNNNNYNNNGNNNNYNNNNFYNNNKNFNIGSNNYINDDNNNDNNNNEFSNNNNNYNKINSDDILIHSAFGGDDEEPKDRNVTYSQANKNNILNKNNNSELFLSNKYLNKSDINRTNRNKYNLNNSNSNENGHELKVVNSNKTMVASTRPNQDFRNKKNNYNNNNFY